MTNRTYTIIIRDDADEQTLGWFLVSRSDFDSAVATLAVGDMIRRVIER